MQNKPAKTLSLSLLAGRYAVCQLDANANVDVSQGGAFFSVTRTPDELSVVCEEPVAPEGAKVEGGWRALKVEGPFEFSETGVISSLTKPLAEANVPVFVISTFNTDYLLLKEERLEEAASVLSAAGFNIVGEI